MANSDQNLQAFINKMLQLQNENRDKPLSDEELKKIAFDIGMTEEDWQESQKIYQNHLQNANSHLQFKNWDDAVQEFEQALPFKPNSMEALYGLAVAYQEKWRDEANEDWKKKAEEYAESVLQIKPGHQPALHLLLELRKVEKIFQSRSKQLKIYLIGFSAIAGVFLLIMYFVLNNAVVSHLEEVNKKWAQVENIYQRRADLIPKLVSTLKSETKVERENLQQLSQFYQATTKQSDEDPQKFLEAQKKLGQELEALSRKMAQDGDLRLHPIYKELVVNLEGSENRIAVERKRYNEAVAAYNQYIKKFPQSLLGYKVKPYFEVDKRALENPDLDLN